MPILNVSVDGQPVSGHFQNRLTRLKIVDKDGLQSDEIEVEFDDSPPHIAAPKRGGEIAVSLSIPDAGQFKGSYVINSVEQNCFPFSLTVGGHASDFRSDMKSSRTKSWDNITIKQIVVEKAKTYGLKTRIADAVSSYKYKWIGQEDESDLSFLEQLADKHGVMFTIKNGYLLWLEKGTSATSDGTVIPAKVITPGQIIKGTLKVRESDLESYKKIKAYWQDYEDAKRQEVIIDANPEGEGEFTISEPFFSKAEAEAAAKTKALEFKRGQITTSCSIVIDPDLSAGQSIVYQGVRENVDAKEFVLTVVTIDFSKSTGFKMHLEGKLKL